MTSVSFHPSTSHKSSHPPPAAAKPSQPVAAAAAPSPPTAFTIPRLDDLTIAHIAANFSTCPVIDHLPAHYVPNLLHLLSSSPPLPLPLSLRYIESEEYWQWRAQRDFPPPLDLIHHGGRWKRLYCERWLCRRLEGWKQGAEGWEGGVEALQREVRQVEPFVHTVELTMLPSHVDVAAVLGGCHRLSSLVAQFGCRRLLMDYDPRLIGMNDADAGSIARLLSSTACLTKLCLTGNEMTPQQAQSIAASLPHCACLTHLDLTHNNIGDEGAAHIVSALPRTLLSFLSLADNGLSAAAMTPLASALLALPAACNPLHLSLSLNSIGDAGWAELCRGLAGGKLWRLEAVAVGIGAESRDGLMRAVRGKKGGRLQELLIGCNTTLGEGDDGAELLRAVRDNAELWLLDAVRCGWPESVLKQLQDTMEQRVEADKQSRRKAADSRR